MIGLAGQFPLHDGVHSQDGETHGINLTVRDQTMNILDTVRTVFSATFSGELKGKLPII